MGKALLFQFIWTVDFFFEKTHTPTTAGEKTLYCTIPQSLRSLYTKMLLTNWSTRCRLMLVYKI